MNISALAVGGLNFATWEVTRSLIFRGSLRRQAIGPLVLLDAKIADDVALDHSGSPGHSLECVYI